MRVSCITLSAILLGLTGCAFRGSSSDSPEVINTVIVGKWDNIYQGNESLAGVVVEQLPENPIDAECFRNGEHPCVIQYVFWSGNVHKITYSPEGVTIGDVWWKVEKDDGFWKEVDFSLGSDPDFERHKDPRKVVESRGENLDGA